MKCILLILACFIYCCLVSCSKNYYKEPVLLSTKSVSMPKYEVLGKAEKKACNTSVLIFPISIATFDGMSRDVMEQAESIGGDALIDFQVRESFFLFTFFYNRRCFLTTGTVVKYLDGN